MIASSYLSIVFFFAIDNRVMTGKVDIVYTVRGFERNVAKRRFLEAICAPWSMVTKNSRPSRQVIRILYVQNVWQYLTTIHFNKKYLRTKRYV